MILIKIGATRPVLSPQIAQINTDGKVLQVAEPPVKPPFGALVVAGGNLQNLGVGCTVFSSRNSAYTCGRCRRSRGRFARFSCLAARVGWGFRGCLGQGGTAQPGLPYRVGMQV